MTAQGKAYGGKGEEGLMMKNSRPFHSPCSVPALFRLLHLVRGHLQGRPGKLLGNLEAGPGGGSLGTWLGPHPHGASGEATTVSWRII